MGYPLVAALIAAGAIHFDANQQYPDAAACANCVDHLRHWHTAWTAEYGAAVAQLQRAIERASHQRDPRLFACVHGPPGPQGVQGRAGHWDLPDLADLGNGDAVDITALIVQAMGGRLGKCARTYTYVFARANARARKLDDGFRCDVDAAVSEIMQRHLLPRLYRIDFDMMPGPQGPVGRDGLNASLEIREEYYRHCFPPQADNTPLARCPFVTVLAHQALWAIEQVTRDAACPTPLYGPMGGDGPRGPGGVTVRLGRRKPEWAAVFQGYCPTDWVRDDGGAVVY